MNRQKIGHILLIAILLTLGCGSVTGQTLESLRQEIERAEKEIRATNDLLSKTKTDQKATQSQLNLVRSRIKNRKSIVNNLERQTTLLGKQIGEKNGTIQTLSSEVELLRKEYAEMVYHAYKNYKLNNFMLFLFASKDFNDATRRVTYMRRYNQMRKLKAAEIDSTSQKIGIQVTDLEGKKQELEKVHDARVNELAALAKDEIEVKSVEKQLRTKAGKLTTTIKSNQNKISNLQKQIERIIAEEARKNKSTSRTAAQEEYIANLSGQFDQNKGRLPYPVRGGVVIDGYGIHPHPDQKGLMVNNKGVNIAASSGADIRSVFEGEVATVVLIPGFNNSILIRHGNYLSVYSNLERVTVKNGDKVALNQVIGQLSSSNNSDDHVLHFEIWKETTNLNPEGWLKR